MLVKTFWSANHYIFGIYLKIEADQLFILIVCFLAKIVF